MISECSKYSTYSFPMEQTLCQTHIHLHINKVHDNRKLVFQCRATEKTIGSKGISPNQKNQSLLDFDGCSQGSKVGKCNRKYGRGECMLREAQVKGNISEKEVFET